jgi:hypothetical protein
LKRPAGRTVETVCAGGRWRARAPDCAPAVYRARSMSLPLTRPEALLIAARRPDPGNGRLIAAVSVGDPAAAPRAGERLKRCDGLIFVITVPSTFRAMLRGSRRSTSSWTSSPTLRASTGNTLAAQRSSAPSTTGCGVSSMDSPRIPFAAGVWSPRCFSDPPFTPTGDHAWQ